MVRLLLVSLLGLQGALALSPFAPRSEKATDAVPFVNPSLAGGSLLDRVTNELGEPLNVIISGLSSPGVLSDDGFLEFANAIGFGTECLGIHLGDPQAANLGDGNGYVNQTVELRQDYGNPDIGSCLESLSGGNHLRLFRQNGPTANTGALFLAVSQEENIFKGHTISPDGYNIGRDKFVQGALGVSLYKGVNYQTVAQNITGLLPPGSAGINHGIATDGVVVLLTVTIAS
ncbi:hypothetical protein BJY52DRAFT_227983 [Lactarius psammicola]|nr:hypothetical protein BJY52DRAFT_227983 [Lactarius psammicola]